MTGSSILRFTAGYLNSLLLLFSLFLLVRGHHEPGGGFVGGLVAASGFALYTLAHGPAAARRVLKVDPLLLIPAGLLLGLLSGLAGMAGGQAFLTAVWLDTPVGKLGTPLVFDAGVYVTVAGVTLTAVLALAEST